MKGKSLSPKSSINIKNIFKSKAQLKGEYKEGNNLKKWLKEKFVYHIGAC